jgi:hypothetical protein
VIDLKLVPNLTPRHHLPGSSAIHVGLIEYGIRSHMCWPGGQHLLLTVNQIARIEGGELKPMPMRNRVRRTSLHAIPTKDTSIVIDVVDLGVALGAAYAVFGGVVGRFDVDAIRGAVGGAEEAGYAFFQAVFVALQDVSATEAGFEARSFERTFAVGIIFNRGGLEHLQEGDAHALGDGGDVFQNRHYPSSIPKGAGSGCHRRQGVRNRCSALSLGSFARYWLVTLAWAHLALVTPAWVTLAWVGARFMGKRKIWGVRALQTLPFSPPAEKREQCANDDYQHPNRNQKP